MRRAIVLGALALVVVGLVLWRGPAPGPAPTLSVARVGYWQTATVAGQPAAAVRAALRALGPRTAAPGDRGPRYAIQLASSRVLYDPEASALEVGTAWHRLPPLSAAAFGQAASDAESSFHGELVAWDVAQHLFPLRADALVVDYATGLRFWVRRLAGSAHADVQPLTAADTATMKEIYGGQWSWARRPILVEVSGHRLAASMNGMPHGAGAIEANDFPGHFCIHFLLSQVHKTRAIDPGHVWAILTAAGVSMPRPPIPVTAPVEGC